MNKSFCVMPWINISADSDGSIKPCCISSQFITKENGERYNLGYDKIEDIVNSVDYVEIRRKMLAGELVDGCSRCHQSEMQGDESSKRQMYNDRWLTTNLTQEKINQGTIIDSRVADIDLRFGNLCNLACKSCNTLYSSRLEKEIKEIGFTDFYTYRDTSTINDWYETEIFNQNIDSQLQNLSQIYITGGEPTIIKKNYEVLEKLVHSGRSKQMRLIINSNMTNLNTKFYSLIKEFENVTFYASIDGYGLVQEYIRYPSNWEQIDKNFRYLLDNFDNITLRPMPVIQLLNLNKMVELFDYFESFNKVAGKSIVNILPINLQVPPQLDCINLPLEYKKEAWNSIEVWMDNNRDYQDPSFFKKMQVIKTKCFMDVDYKHELSRFFQMNDMFDNNRNVHLADINPDLDKLRLPR